MADPGEMPRILKGIALPRSEKDEDSRSWTIAGVKVLHHDGIFGRKKLDFKEVFRRMAEGGRSRGFGPGIDRGLEVVQLSDRRCDVERYGRLNGAGLETE